MVLKVDRHCYGHKHFFPFYLKRFEVCIRDGNFLALAGISAFSFVFFVVPRAVLNIGLILMREFYVYVIYELSGSHCERQLLSDTPFYPEMVYRRFGAMWKYWTRSAHPGISLQV